LCGERRGVPLCACSRGAAWRRSRHADRAEHADPALCYALAETRQAVAAVTAHSADATLTTTAVDALQDASRYQTPCRTRRRRRRLITRERVQLRSARWQCESRTDVARFRPTLVPTVQRRRSRGRQSSGWGSYVPGGEARVGHPNHWPEYTPPAPHAVSRRCRRAIPSLTEVIARRRPTAHVPPHVHSPRRCRTIPRQRLASWHTVTAAVPALGDARGTVVSRQSISAFV